MINSAYEKKKIRKNYKMNIKTKRQIKEFTKWILK